MAGLKKPSRRNESSPNLVLIIFLVFFILVSIGLGVWGYYGYAGQEKLVADAKRDAALAKGAKEGENYWRMVALDTFQMIGQPLDADQMIDLNALRDEFLKEGGKFDKEKTRDLVKKGMEEGRKNLGFKPDERKYDKTFPEELTRLTKVVTEKDADIARLQAEVKQKTEKFKDLQDGQDKQHKLISDNIEAQNKIALGAARQRAAEFAKAVELNDKLSKDVQDATLAKETSDRDNLRQIGILKAQMQEMQNKRVELVSATRNPSDVHALLLDISRGKTLWDRPLGKIVRVDMGQRQVAINLGSSSGAKPEQTFSIFGPGAYGGAEDFLKGTIEITRVLDTSTSLARITSLYDAKGEEVLLNAQGTLQLQRESDAALRPGDLLFNMFWGNHVAIAGPASLTGHPAKAPAEQMRQLTEFGYFCEQRLGMPIDAYLDLATTKIEGQMNWNTRYLILASDIPTDANDPQAERVKNINEFMAAMKKEAIEKGMFIISVENFLNVVGYRAPRSARETGEYAGFRPSLPKAGIARPARFVPGAANQPAVEAAPNADAAPMEEKKAPDKEKEEK